MDYTDFFTNVRGICSRTNRPPVDLGFNPFALMSDMYHRENFHSDIIAAILNPNCSHNEKGLFLQSFIDLLVSLAEKQNKHVVAENLQKLSISDEIVVSRENYRTDIAIYSVRDQWSILIENKINYAEDQDRQLVRYLNDWSKDGRHIKPLCIVYLKPFEEAMPDMHNWTKDEKDAVMNLLVSVAGYCPGKESLYEWLKKCELNSIIFNNKAVFSQYAEVVKQQAGMDMNEKDIFDFLTEVKNSNINLNDLLATVNQLPQFYASWLMNRLLAEHPLGDKIWIWSKSVCVIDFRVQHNGESIRFAFDIPCEDLSNPGITFFARDDSTKIELFKETLDKQGYVFNSAWSRWCKHCCNTKYPDLTELEQILKEVKCCLEEMKKRKQELEK